MCGIAGAFNLPGTGGSRTEVEVGLRRLGEKLSAGLLRRGPDDKGLYVDAKAGAVLVQRRLAIMDLSSAGHQPMFDESGRFGIVFNGEIYNFAEVRRELESAGHVIRSHSDTEVLLHAYMAWGHEALPRLRGMFAFAVLDCSGANPRLFCARDRLGIKPFVYGAAKHPTAGAGHKAMSFFFSSECGALVDAGLVENRLRPEALWEYGRTGAIQQPGTVYAGLRQLRPGHYLEVDEAGAGAERCWYDLHSATVGLRAELAGKDFAELAAITRTRLEEAARYHAIADVSVGAFLSGGVDSAAVAGLLAGQSSGPIQAFTIGFERQGEVLDELAAARASAAFLHADHHAATITDADAAAAFPEFIATLDQPSIDGFNTWLVSRCAAGTVKVALSGLGGDELFAGYPHHAQIAQAQGRALPTALRAAVAALHSLRPNHITRRWLYRGATPEEAVRTFRNYIPQGALARLLQRSECSGTVADEAGYMNELSCGNDSALPPLAAIARSELAGYLLSTLLRDCDVCSMAHGLEVRPILLDHVLVEHAFALPDSAKIRDGHGKAALVEAVRSLIAPGCWRRPKSGFEIPFGRWLCGGLRERFRALLHGTLAAGLLNPSCRSGIERDLAEPGTARRHWRWLALLSWLDSRKINF